MRAALLVVALGLVGGCVRSASPRLYTLVAVPGPVVQGTPHVVEIRRPQIAGYLDRDEVVRAVMSQHLSISYGDRWAAPLEEMIARVLAEDLSLRLPNAHVFSEVGALSVGADTYLELDVQRFERGDDEQVVLLAQVAIRQRDAERAAWFKRFELRATPDGRDEDALVDTMAALLGGLADRIAQQLAQQAILEGSMQPHACLGGVTP